MKKGAAVKKRKTEELADKDKKDKYEPLMGAQGANAHGALMRGKSRKGAGKMECFRPFTEGVVIAEDKREVRCRIISEGLGNRVDMNYYGPEVIVQFAKMLNGSKCFINHPTSMEESQRPEGDLWNQCAYWKDVIAEMIEGKMTAVGTLCLDLSEAGNEGMANIKHTLRYAADFPALKEVYCGISVNGDGETERKTKTIDGQESEVNDVTAITKAGADLVTQPARGGKILGLLESIQNSKDPQEGNTIMKRAMKVALTKIAKRFKGLSEAEDTSAQGVLDMLRESATQLKVVAAASGTKLKEADDDEKKKEVEDYEKKKQEVEDYEKKKEADDDEKKDEADDDEKKKEVEDYEKKKQEVEDYEKKKEADDDEKKDEADDDEKKDEADDDEDMDESKGGKKESAKVRDLRGQLKEARGKLDTQSIAKSIKEAGLDGDVTVEELAAFAPAQRKVMLGWKRQMNEASGFSPIGTTQRGAGARGGSKLGESFVSGVTARTGAQG